MTSLHRTPASRKDEPHAEVDGDLSVEGPKPKSTAIVDDIRPACITLRILNYGNYGIFLIMGNAGFISSNVSRIPNPRLPAIGVQGLGLIMGYWGT